LDLAMAKKAFMPKPCVDKPNGRPDLEVEGELECLEA